MCQWVCHKRQGVPGGESIEKIGQLDMGIQTTAHHGLFNGRISMVTCMVVGRVAMMGGLSV